ncbi:hypothetical protein [Xanthovirga aplysinae]|uniref:hypothetical protein n=1 Tax=Xanthovirga aplysinae TaxID=2529853 RepID=UPI0012BD406B|nr:hypothetical protein [Xanthovirga aplysinae]MTI32597.1 hypothetical protein [Xanthovirga aplysinae]
MNKIGVKILFFLVAVTAKLGVFAQGNLQSENGIDFQKAFDEYIFSTRPELIYLELNQPYFVTGDQLSYKAFFLDGISHALLQYDNLLNVEILSPQGERVLSHKVKLEGGVANGKFLLPEDLNEGVYTVRAFTSWMRNFNNSGFSQQVPIYSLDNKGTSENSPPTDKEEIFLEFYPVGGQLVEGIRSIVAFKAYNENGKGVNINGEIRDQEGRLSGRLSITSPGEGKFALRPQENKNYHVVISNPKGGVEKFPLPPIVKEGIVVHTSTSINDEIALRISSNKQGPEKVILVLRSKEGVLHQSVNTILGGNLSFKIPSKDLPEGIIQIDIFDLKGILKASNGVLLESKGGSVGMTTDKTTYGRGENIKLSLLIQDAKGIPVKGNLSLRVRKKQSLNNPWGDVSNIQDFLLFNAFQSKNGKRAKVSLKDKNKVSGNLDPQMLVHLWEKTSVDKLINQNIPSPSFGKRQAYLTLEGKVLEKSTGRPIKGEEFAAAILGNFQLYNFSTDNEGEFSFPIFNFQGKENLFFFPLKDNLNKKDLLISLNEKIPSTGLLNDIPLPYSKEIEEYINQSKLRRVMQTAFGLDNNSENLAPKYLFIEDFDKKFVLDEYFSFDTMREVIIEILEGVSFKKESNGQGRIYLYDWDNKILFQGEPLIVIDGKPSFDPKFFTGMDPAEIEEVRLLNSSESLASYGQAGLNGILTVKTKSGNFGHEDLTYIKQIDGFSFSGGREENAFKEIKENPNDKIPNLGPLRYWNSELTTDSEGKAQVLFNAGDEVGEYIVELQGISNEGKPIVSTYTFMVGEVN